MIMTSVALTSAAVALRLNSWRVALVMTEVLSSPTNVKDHKAQFIQINMDRQEKGPTASAAAGGNPITALRKQKGRP